MNRRPHGSRTNGNQGLSGAARGKPAAPERSWFHRFRTALVHGQKTAVTTEVLQDDNPQRFLDPAVIGRFGLSPLLTKRVVEGFLSGLHKSPFHGFSVEFSDHREYVPGDDLRFLDWHLFARTDHYYVKRYEEETNVRCHILLDRSASMAFGTGGLTKWDYSCFLSTCLAYLMIKQQDAVGLGLFGVRPGVLVPPRCRGSHLRQIMQVMIQNPPGGRTNLAASLQATLRNLKRRSLVIIVSDLIDDPDETLKSIRLIGSHRHDVIVFHVQDPAELEFDFAGSTLFRDVETGEELEVDPDAIRETYLDKVQELINFYRKNLIEVGIDYHSIDTRTPYDHALWAYLGQRQSLRK
jgi:uncharacterized protein (DUF58 family)